MTFRSSWCGAVLCAAILMTAMPLQAQDTKALLDRIERLERDIRTLNVQISRGGTGGVSATSSAADAAGGDNTAYARLNVRVSQIETGMRNLTGRLEELSYQINQVSQQLEKLSADVDFRLKQLETGGTTSGMRQPMQNGGQMTAPQGQPQSSVDSMSGQANASTSQGAGNGAQVLGTLNESDLNNPGQQANTAAPAQKPAESEADALLAQLTGDTPAPASQPAAPATAPSAAPAPAGVNTATSQPASVPSTQTAALPQGTPRAQYMHAFGLLRQGNYDMAASSLRQFLEAHGDDKLASNARYWLGETYYVRGSFVEAAETFLEGYQADPQGPKAPDALLKLGMSLSSLDKKNEACAAFQKLRQDYPDASAGLKSTLQREWQKNGCV